MTEHTPIFLPDGRCVGEVCDGVYNTRRRRSAHMLQKPPAWAIDLVVLDELRRAGVRSVAVHEVERGETFTASLEAFYRQGVRVSRGFGEQIALPLAYWRVDGRRSLAEQQAEAQAAKQAQLSLFGFGEVLR